MAIDEFKNALKQLLSEAVRYGIPPEQICGAVLLELYDSVQKDAQLRNGR